MGVGSASAELNCAALVASPHVAELICNHSSFDYYSRMWRRGWRINNLYETVAVVKSLLPFLTQIPQDPIKEENVQHIQEKRHSQ